MIFAQDIIIKKNRDIVYLVGGSGKHTSMIFRNGDKGLHFEFEKIIDENDIFGRCEQITFYTDYYWETNENAKKVYVRCLKDVTTLLDILRGKNNGIS